MKVATVMLEGRRRHYLLFEYASSSTPLYLAKDERSHLLEQVASSEIYFDESTGTMAKVKSDKHRWRKRPLRWFFRDFIEKRLLFQFEARKEVRSKKVVRAAGLLTPDCVAWGVSLNPFNRRGSLLLMEHLDGVMTGEQYFQGLNEAGRKQFLAQFCEDVMLLARAGYVHRDLHMNNVLCRPTGSIIWVDTHVKPMPRGNRAKWRAIYRSISQRGLLNDYYRQWIHDDMKQRWLAG
ncbi:lipopolysaccharide kinase InaA family protein [Halomonas sp. BC04]|uniref:lipopolysaccharide kinase InaA family protein n=1 Tax=Halomonas sp. BC04 TaxID=1403540 RepID=UPI0003ED7DE7|nr:lipopolysaccharide kinase InaA family protein [Halomonas sp. BC04]EWG99639.1 hypothetical protein Q427_23755 [Halomonas sp. BC04]